MRLIQVSDNGNTAAIHRHKVSSHRSFDNRSWLTSNNSDFRNNISQTDNSEFHSNYKIYKTTESGDDLESLTITKANDFDQNTSDVNSDAVCNKQYRLNTQNSIHFVITPSNIPRGNLEGVTNAVLAPRERFVDSRNTDASSNATPIDEERAFEQSDTDDMSETSVHPVPRGIVNPNYPGFQHLAHTLQDYSTDIDNFYHSENEMTDDDVDLDIVESTYDQEPNQNGTPIEYENINNNNSISDTAEQTLLSSQNVLFSQTLIVDSHIHNEIPDLLKTISINNNNNNTSDFDLNCSDADIENNFHTKDIIGDFNKEVEDEIKQLLNYNINIEDDLQELRKDIKDTFTKPIENTINNISEVVNHVIKKLVETHNEPCEQTESVAVGENTFAENNNINKDNETNTRTEMNLSRPTFLLLEKNTNGMITDAFLSDAKEEINIYENDYDTEMLSENVERTIQQLSTELRKIIPKLDEMREHDGLWARNKNEPHSTTTDGNSNEVASFSKYYSQTATVPTGNEAVCGNSTFTEVNAVDVKVPIINIFEPKSPRNTQKETLARSCFRSAHSNTSVRKHESTRDCELGSFDVYNIETALPKIDIDAIENHLKAAKEEERRKRNDREEIRKRLAMGADSEEYYSMGHVDRPGRKPSLQSRLQNGKNLQICFMNETASDNESQTSDVERSANCSSKSLSRSSIFSKNNFNHPYQTRPLSVNITKNDKIGTVQSVAKLRPSSLSLKTPKSRSSHSLGYIELRESDFYALQVTLQTEARIALAQAKEMARLQMERERRSRSSSPVTEMLRRSMLKANAPLAADRRRVSRQLLTDMNIAQLQVIVNELHSQIECLNESLVNMLMQRDELHMGQDSMLVDIEDLTRYLGVKEQTKKTKGPAKSGIRRLTSLVHK